MDIEGAGTVRAVIDVVPIAAGKRGELHAAGARESLGHKSKRAYRRGNAERREVSNLVHAGAARLALFDFIVGIAGNKEDVPRSKGDAAVVILANPRRRGRIRLRYPGKSDDVPIRIAYHRDLIDPARGIIGPTADQHRISIVILEGKTAVRRGQPGNGAQVDAGIMVGKRRCNLGSGKV